MYNKILMKGAEMDPAFNLEILKHMLQRDMKERKFQHLSRKFIEWSYGPIQTSIYDLTSIDSCEENSALEILAYNCN
ncbi:Transient receptor potential cation channel subfamily V member 2, partial [Ophiophagus hannah]